MDPSPAAEGRAWSHDWCQQVQPIVKNIQECFKVYRVDISWLALFMAFR